MYLANLNIIYCLNSIYQAANMSNIYLFNKLLCACYNFLWLEWLLLKNTVRFSILQNYIMYTII